MVYTMHFKVDGGCRRNGYQDSIGAAAAVLIPLGGTHKFRTTFVPLGRKAELPTNQRAEISAIILALEMALEEYHALRNRPLLEVTIESDSKYAIGCMTEWIYKWSNNGWRNAAGNEVANTDLIVEAAWLEDQVRELGTVKYGWIPRAENRYADQLCNEALDEQE